MRAGEWPCPDCVSTGSGEIAVVKTQVADVPVLIVGAGPTGAILGIELGRRGVACRVVDRLAGPATTSRSFTLHARRWSCSRWPELLTASSNAACALSRWIIISRAPRSTRAWTSRNWRASHIPDNGPNKSVSEWRVKNARTAQEVQSSIRLYHGNTRE